MKNSCRSSKETLNISAPDLCPGGKPNPIRYVYRKASDWGSSHFDIDSEVTLNRSQKDKFFCEDPGNRGCGLHRWYCGPCFLPGEGHKAVIFDNLSHGHRAAARQGSGGIRGGRGCRTTGAERIFPHYRQLGEPLSPAFLRLFRADRGRRVDGEAGGFFSQATPRHFRCFKAMQGPRRLVFSSTAAVYGEPESVPIREEAHLLRAELLQQSKLLVDGLADRSTADSRAALCLAALLLT